MIKYYNNKKIITKDNDLVIDEIKIDNNINESLVTFTGSKYQSGSSYSSLPSPSKSDIPATKLFTISIYDSTDYPHNIGDILTMIIQIILI